VRLRISPRLPITFENRTQPHRIASQRVRTAIYESLQDLLLFPRAGRRQMTEGIRKFVTRKYSYLIYCTLDEANDEIIVLAVKHPAQKREHDDA
jgi:toxin ParE1/3/4